MCEIFVQLAKARRFHFGIFFPPKQHHFQLWSAARIWEIVETEEGRQRRVALTQEYFVYAIQFQEKDEVLSRCRNNSNMQEDLICLITGVRMQPDDDLCPMEKY
jgi:hypothetical protein